VTERLKVHAWKACVRKRTWGSNPHLSAIINGAFAFKSRGGLLLFIPRKNKNSRYGFPLNSA
jgi:hypothetical protein